jgi:ABC-type nitrate/sulfonate/bicarbonate transport system permease component
MKQDKDYKQQEKTMKPWKITAAQILFLAAILALQEYVVVKGYVSSLFLAAPSGIAASLLELFSGSDLFHHLLITLLEFVA